MDRIPRLTGSRCGVKLTVTGLPAKSLKVCSISGVWRWLGHAVGLEPLVDLTVEGVDLAAAGRRRWFPICCR